MPLLPETITSTRDAASHRTDHQTLHRRFNGIVDVRDYGAVGDDSTDDTTAISNAYAQVPIGGELFFPANYTFKVTSALTLAKAITVVGTGSVMHQVTSGAEGFAVTATGVQILGLTLQGPQTPGSLSYNSTEIAIDLDGVSAAAPLNNSIITDCEMYGWGRSGIESFYVNNLRWQNNYIHDVAYAGILSLCPQRGLISSNRIVTIGPGTSSNCYGIAVTRNSTSNLSLDPRPTDINITNNTIEHVTIWEGIDTHGGQRIQVANNIIRDCDQGIAMTTSPFGANVLAPVDCSVIGNTIDSTSTNGTRKTGIYMIGDTSDYATGQISNNTVIGHGTENDSSSGGILLYFTRGALVQGNYSRDCSPAAIQASNNNTGILVTGNMSQDNWCTSGNANGVCVSSNPNTGLVLGNVMVRGPKSAGSVNTATVFVAASNTITSTSNLSF